MSILITVTAYTPEELEWRERELKKILISQDISISACTFREEAAFLSSLPLVSFEKHLYNRARRNVLTTGAASCYPFTAYELSDDNGILLGVNKYNNSLVIVDIFNSAVYRNANIAIVGTSGKNLYNAAYGFAYAKKRYTGVYNSPIKGSRVFKGLQKYRR